MKRREQCRFASGTATGNHIAGPRVDLFEYPTWPTPSTAYLRLPFQAEAARRLMSENSAPFLVDADGTLLLTALPWMRQSLPAGLVLDISRPAPADRPPTAPVILRSRDRAAPKEHAGLLQLP